jgi:hypothetical protein
LILCCEEVSIARFPDDKKREDLKKRRSDGLILLMLGAIAFIVIGSAWRHVSPIEMGDFKVVYYSARCLLQHSDPYSQSDVLSVYQTEGRERSDEPVLDRQVKTRFFYPPTAFIFTLPFAFAGFVLGKLIWTMLLGASLIVAATLVWDIGADFAPLLSGTLSGFLLMNSFWLFMVGNAAGIAVSMCVIAVWCFYRDRFAWLGVICLALSLALKPNDSGLVWLFLLLAGSTYRKRAIQSVAVLAVLTLPIIVWVTHVSPHWPAELSANMSSFSVIGGIVDPAATGMAGRNMDSLVQLQSAVSIFCTSPHTYDLITYAICAPVVLVWAFVTLRDQTSDAGMWLSLATAAPLSMLPTYHFQHDAKLLLLTIPACSILWSKRGLLGRLSLIVTGAGILLNGDIFSAARILLTRGILVPQPTFASRLITMVLTRPAPLILLTMTVFYLGVYAKFAFSRNSPSGFENFPQEREKPKSTRQSANYVAPVKKLVERFYSYLLRSPAEREQSI